MIHLDTHVVAWLFAGQVERIPAPARQRLEAEPLGISPMVSLELTYLCEVGRLAEPGEVIVEDLERRIGLKLLETPFGAIIAAARSLSWTRDPFDRLIGAQAVVEGAQLLTADETLRARLSCAVWG